MNETKIIQTLIIYYDCSTNALQMYPCANEDIVGFLDSTDRKAPLLIYCYHGINSKDAAEYFVNNGFHTVFSLDGGYSEFSQQKL